MIYIIVYGIKGPVSSSKAGAGWPAAREREKVIASATVTNEMCKTPFIREIRICTIYKNGHSTTEIRRWNAKERSFAHQESYRHIADEDRKAISGFESRKTK